MKVFVPNEVKHRVCVRPDPEIDFVLEKKDFNENPLTEDDFIIFKSKIYKITSIYPQENLETIVHGWIINLRTLKESGMTKWLKINRQVLDDLVFYLETNEERMKIPTTRVYQTIEKCLECFD